MRTLIGMANANIESDLRSLLEEIDAAEVVGVAQTSGELVDYAGRLTPEVVMLHENLGPEPVIQTIRDLSLRHPSVAVVLISGERTPQTVIRAMEAGARGVVGHPFAFDDLSAKISAARDWSVQMQQVLAGAIAQASSLRGRVVSLVGAKGGVGTTTLATHLALDHFQADRSRRVCLVDLDLEKGDVSAILEVRQAVSIADLAKVHKDLSPVTVRDAVVRHECGLDILLTPADVRLTEVVTAESLRAIFALLRREFDLIVVDGGGSVSPAQATVVELADDVVVVTTADVLAVRAMRKRMVAWEALGVRAEGDLRVLVNKVDRTSIFPSSAVAQLTTASVLDAKVPVSTRTLEPAMNERDPRAVTEVAWWRLMESVRAEIGLPVSVPTSRRTRPSRGKGGKGGQRAEAVLEEQEQAARATPAPPAPSPPQEPVPATPAPEQQPLDAAAGADVATAGAAKRERGQVALENVVAFPMAIFMALAAWQIVVIGLTFVFSSHAARVAAREYSVTGSVSSATSEARDASPWVFGNGVTVSGSSGGDKVTVTMKVPAAGPASLGFPQRLSATREVVSER